MRNSAFIILDNRFMIYYSDSKGSLDTATLDIEIGVENMKA